MRASGSRWFALPALSGVLLGVAFLPGPFLPLNLAGFVPLLVALDARPEASAYDRLKIGLAFGVPAYMIGVHFMYSMLAFSWLASLLYVATVFAFAARAAAVVVLVGWLRRKTGLAWSLLLPFCWIPMEWLSTWGDLRMPVDHLYHAVAGYPFLVQFADVVGPYGVDLVLLVTGGAVCDLLFAGWRRRRSAIVLAVVWSAVLAYDAWAWAAYAKDDPGIRVGIVQPNVSFEVKHDRAREGEQIQTLRKLSTLAAESGAELIIWPESARPRPVYHWLERPESFAMPEVQGLARELGVAFLVGVEYARVRSSEDYELYNAALAVEADGRLVADWTAKHYLVPFTEGIPLETLIGPLVRGKGGEWSWLSGGFDPGAPPIPLAVAGTRIGVLVCYEQAFPELSRRLRNSGAALQVVITNDAWWARSFFQRYQANMVRLRAIENRSAFVRVANTGISGFVDRRGRYHRMTRLFEEAVEVREVPPAGARTIYDRTGNVVAWFALCGLVASVAAAYRER